MAAFTKHIQLIVGTVAVAICLLSINASTAFAATFTWSGQHPTDGSWSEGANWVGGVPPSGSVDVLVFPELTGPECQAFDEYPYEAACYETNNDITGLSTGELRVAGRGLYHLDGNGIALGSGGFTVIPPGFAFSFYGEVSIPLHLAADQTWHHEAGGIFVSGGITGSDADLTIELGALQLGGVNEVGQVTLRGGGSLAGEQGVFALLGDSATLNASSGNGVRAENVTLGGTGTFGELTTTDALITPWQPYDSSIHPVPVSRPFTLDVNGDVMLDPGTGLPFNLGDTSALDRYQRLTASGDVDLAGAATSFQFGGGIYGYQGCGPDPPLGHVFTMVSTTGTVTGQFAGLPDGAIVHPAQNDYYYEVPEPDYIRYCPQHLLQIDYKAHSVEATVVERTVRTRPVRTPPQGPTVLSQQPTGLRAAAMKRCATKDSKKARRKCRAKARRLPI